MEPLLFHLNATLSSIQHLTNCILEYKSQHQTVGLQFPMFSIDSLSDVQNKNEGEEQNPLTDEEGWTYDEGAQQHNASPSTPCIAPVPLTPAVVSALEMPYPIHSTTKRSKAYKLVVLDPAHARQLLFQPTGKLYVNRHYVDPASTLSPLAFHTVMAYVFSFVYRDDGTPYIILGRNKCSPSLVLMAFVYLNRTNTYRNIEGEDAWPPSVNPIFKTAAELNLFIQRHKLFIIQFYHFCYTGRRDNGIQLLERRVSLITDEELSQPYTHRFLLNRWKTILDYTL